MRHMAPFTAEQEAEIKSLYAQGYGVPQITEMTGEYCCRSKINNWLKREGLLRTVGQGRACKHARLVGHKFGKLTLLERIFSDNGKRIVSVWKCRCDCGNVKNILQCSIVGGNTKSCGCLLRKAGKDNRSWKGFGDISGNNFQSYVSGARYRGLEFNLSIEYIWNLFLGQNKKCALTGVNLSFGRTNVDSNSASLDRIDSSCGYIEGNVQWVHKWVNIFKKDMSEEELFAIARGIYITKHLENYTGPSVEEVLGSAP